LLGTVTLPAAIIFTFLLIISIATPQGSFAQDSVLPLIMLCCILFLPALLVLINIKKASYRLWMVIYMIALPVWNFALPVYAFWHFDDFSWGKTRLIAGEKKGDGHGMKQGRFDSTGIVHRRWIEYERDQRRGIAVPPRAALEDNQEIRPRSSSAESVQVQRTRMSAHERRLSGSPRQAVFLEAFGGGAPEQTTPTSSPRNSQWLF
jgi:chitin synthase